jgi:AraC-like DNA-binding protein
MGLAKPLHPLITVLNTANLEVQEALIGQRFVFDFYCIALKNAAYGINYGRNHYDFNEGVLIFIAPKQVITITELQELNQIQGWMLNFHPDLIHNSSLDTKICNYNFFNYKVHEALHLSEKEQGGLNNIVQLIQNEINEHIDNHSLTLLVSNIELILNYSFRFYERQFNTRSFNNLNIVVKVENLLKRYFLNNNMLEVGQPSIQFLADKCHVSSSYLSDQLIKETGRSTKDHINDFLVEKAKQLLLSSTDSVSGIAYSLGFNYPHYFGRLFKQKTGKTPNEYRQKAPPNEYRQLN